MTYRIKTVSELTGIPKNTLVAWERRYGILSPERQANGYRTYSDADVALLMQLKHRLGEGLKISEAVELLKESGRDGEPPATTSEEAYDSLRTGLVDALTNFRRAEAEQITHRLAHLSFQDTIEHIYFPVLREIGDLWEKGVISVAEEHFASSYLRDQLVAMLLRVGCGPEGGTRVTCVTFPGERHEIPVLAFAVHLALAGCRVTYLGADLPLADLTRFVAQQKPRWLCVSMILPQPRDEVMRYVRKLKKSAPDGMRIVVGGRGLPDGLTDIAGVQFLRDWRDLEIR